MARRSPRSAAVKKWRERAAGSAQHGIAIGDGASFEIEDGFVVRDGEDVEALQQQLGPGLA